MTLTLPIGAWLALIVGCFAWGVIIGAAVILDLTRPARPAPMRVTLARLADPTPLPGELSPFPGADVVTHNDLDQYARHYQGLGR